LREEFKGNEGAAPETIVASVDVPFQRATILSSRW